MIKKLPMKNYYYLLIVLFVSCGSDNINLFDPIKEVRIIEAFSISQETSEIISLSPQKVIVKKDEDGQLEELIVYTEDVIKNYNTDNTTLINEGGVYIIINDSNINILNTTTESKDIELYKILKHYGGLRTKFGVEVNNIYIAESCTAIGTNIEGVEKERTFVFKDELEPHIKQLIVETENGIFIYKVDLKNEAAFYVDLEPIYKLSETSWFSDAPIEKIFLDETESAIKSYEIAYTDHSHAIDDTKLEWESNNKKQMFVMSKISLIEKIQDEI